MGETRLDAELVSDVARSLRTAAAAMMPGHDRLDLTDVDTLIHSTTHAGNFGGLPAGRSLHATYSEAHGQAVDRARDRARLLGDYAAALTTAMADLRSGDELAHDQFLGLRQRLPGEGRGCRGAA